MLRSEKLRKSRSIDSLAHKRQYVPYSSRLALSNGNDEYSLVVFIVFTSRVET